MTILRSAMALVITLTLALVACGQPSSPSAPATPAASAEPTTAPAAPTDTPEAVGVLPAALLFISDENDIARLEVDGTTSVTVADEQALIIDFVVAPTSDVLAYLTIADGIDTTLIRMSADGSGRTELARGVIRGVSIADDGSVQAGMLFDTTDATGGALRPGVWSFPADGSDPMLLVAASDPLSDTTPGTHYQPLAWSPDASQLLLRSTMNMGADGPSGDIGATGLALYDAGSGQTRDLLPLGVEPLCVVPVWGRDGTSVLCANGAAIGPPTPPLWRLELARGEQQTLIPTGESVDQALSPRELADGIYVLVAESAAEIVPQFMPQRLAPDSTVTALLPRPIEGSYDGALWAPDGSGMIIGQPASGANRTIIWQPLGINGEGESVELLSGSIGKFAWANP
ncbi:hypothetical protein [Candidatus Chloroploca asiatica]|uniref:Lipoprotein LpqB beta-propeller domain-containing protein n=1 Tax=Candidatus Chloroploca asiatica TaxID=1506545 RepID=A0A2H3KKW5_9CHLR|nr:hypothetical protein [Candidatus Chloroploca asiatica]PDV98603.1 hypothetical protein A9Q02_14535 [Candidatus Chloroploca asiatica]